MNLLPADYLFIIERALAEDLGKQGDITTQAIFAEEIGTATIYAKQSGVLAGLEIARQVFQMVDSHCQCQAKWQDGRIFGIGDIILQMSGRVVSLLRAERTALNFLGRLSGIATLTQKYVAKIRNNSHCQILDTRKTTPGWRRLEKYAVAIGGGQNHRFGLFDMVLVKDNHITAVGGITPAVKKIREYLHANTITAAIEVEVTNLTELQEAIDLEVDRIMLDNMPLSTMAAAVKICNHRIPLEASGNVSLETVAEVAATGVEYISIGALTHSAPNCDFSMKIAR